MEIKKLIPYAAAFAGALGLASNLYAADPAKVKEVIELSKKNCIHLGLKENDVSCLMSVTVRDEKNPEGLLEISVRTYSAGGRTSMLLERIAYNPQTKKYFIMQIDDGNAFKGSSVDGILNDGTIDQVVVAASDNKEGPHNLYRIDLRSIRAREIHQHYLDESLGQFIAKAKEKP